MPGPPVRAVVLGDTAWGTTLALLLARNGHMVSLLTRTPAAAAAINQRRENAARLPGIPLPEAIRATADGATACAEARCLVLAVPSHTLRQNLRRLGPHVAPEMLIVSGCKGLEVGTSLRMSEVIAQEWGPNRRCCVLSGPNLAGEIARGLMAGAVVAGDKRAAVAEALDLFMQPAFRVYLSRDVVGVELGGSLKNIIALGAGIGDGWAAGDNAKASFMTRGLAEMARLGAAAGADPLTFAGLAGLGDLVATCTSPLSRNRSVGERLARGQKLDQILAELGHVAEGVNTTRAALALAERLKVELPITAQLYRVLFEGLDPRVAITELMQREPKAEWPRFDAPHLSSLYSM